MERSAPLVRNDNLEHQQMAHSSNQRSAREQLNINQHSEPVGKQIVSIMVALYLFTCLWTDFQAHCLEKELKNVWKIYIHYQIFNKIEKPAY